jgi:hypothetical protein
VLSRFAAGVRKKPAVASGGERLAAFFRGRPAQPDGKESVCVSDGLTPVCESAGRAIIFENLQNISIFCLAWANK